MNASKYAGLSLIEVLISLIIFAVGLLGIASMLLFSNKSNNSSYSKLQAVQSVYDIMDRMRANSTAAINGNYNVSNISSAPVAPSAPSALCNQIACTPSQLASYDIWYWLTHVVGQLPLGSASISTSAAPGSAGNTIVTVTVQWDDSLAQNQLGAIGTVSSANPNFTQLSLQGQL